MMAEQNNKPKHWRETVVRSEDLRWKRPQMELVEDGKADIRITIPLTKLLQQQAQLSYAEGMLTMLKFHRGWPRGKPIQFSDIMKLLRDCGLGDIAKKMTKYMTERER
jgi:hypothetical protein